MSQVGTAISKRVLKSRAETFQPLVHNDLLMRKLQYAPALYTSGRGPAGEAIVELL